LTTSTFQTIDSPYLQKSASHAILPGGRHPNDIRTLAHTPDGIVWIGTADGLFTLQNETFTRADSELAGSSDIKSLSVNSSGALLVGTGLTLAERRSDGNWDIHLTDTWGEGSVTAAAHRSADIVLYASETGLHKLAKDTLKAAPDLYPGRVFRIQEVSTKTVLLGEDGVVETDLKQITRHILRGKQIRDCFRDGTTTYYATSEGLFKEEAGKDPRFVETPIRDLYSVTRTSLGITCGSSSGLFAHASDRWHYFAGPRWLPSDDVRSVVESDGSLLAATGKGLARIHLVPQTLEQKETGFEQRVRHRHLRLKGYVATSRLESPGDLRTNRTIPSDNDGLWTALYLAAQSYRYAVTGSEEARNWANQAFEAIEWLEGVTTIDGFPTKAIVAAGDDTGSEAVPWYPSAGGSWMWKGDCSSDEIDGHMYGYSIFYDLAADEHFRERIVELVNRIMGPILDNGFLLLGKDGQQTRWGVWAPEVLNGPWRGQRGLNSLEILAHLKTAHHITGNSRYADAYSDLIENHGYAENARRTKLTFPGHVNHSDDELAFISYYPLLKYEKDEALRAIYLESLEHAWQIERPERNPWWNYIYGALTGSACDSETAAGTLREIPTDLIDWPIRNSHRLDVQLDAQRGRKGELQSTRVLPYDELPAKKWNRNPYSLDDDSLGAHEDDGTYYLVPYWIGRHYGYLSKGSP